MELIIYSLFLLPAPSMQTANASAVAESIGVNFWKIGHLIDKNQLKTWIFFLE